MDLALLDLAKLKQKSGDERLVDGMQNGRAQKFEYTAELCRKAIKLFFKEKEGVDEASPKKIIKAYYLGSYITEDDSLLLLEAVEDRNRLSHIYDAETFNNILARLPGYAALFGRISAHLTKEVELTIYECPPTSYCCPACYPKRIAVFGALLEAFA